MENTEFSLELDVTEVSTEQGYVKISFIID